MRRFWRKGKEKSEKKVKQRDRNFFPLSPLPHLRSPLPENAKKDLIGRLMCTPLWNALIQTNLSADYFYPRVRKDLLSDYLKTSALSHFFLASPFQVVSFMEEKLPSAFPWAFQDIVTSVSIAQYKSGHYIINCVY